MSEMVERVARALFKMFRSVPPLGEAWRDYENDARTIVIAMRTPTQAMLNEAGGNLSSDRYTGVGMAMSAWTDMIDAALSDHA